MDLVNKSRDKKNQRGKSSEKRVMITKMKKGAKTLQSYEEEISEPPKEVVHVVQKVTSNDEYFLNIKKRDAEILCPPTPPIIPSDEVIRAQYDWALGPEIFYTFDEKQDKNINIPTESVEEVKKKKDLQTIHVGHQTLIKLGVPKAEKPVLTALKKMSQADHYYLPDMFEQKIKKKKKAEKEGKNLSSFTWREVPLPQIDINDYIIENPFGTDDTESEEDFYHMVYKSIKGLRYIRPSELLQSVCTQVEPSRSNCQKCRTKRELATKTEFETVEFIPPQISAYTKTFDKGESIDKEIFILNILTIIPTESISHMLLDKDECEFYFRWKFLNFADEVYFKFGNPISSAKINVYKQYPFKMSKTFYLYFIKCPMLVEMYTDSEIKTNKLIGTFKIPFGDAIRNINKMHKSHFEVSNHDLCWCFPGQVPSIFAKAYCRFIFVGDQKRYDRCEQIPTPLKVVEEEHEITCEDMYSTDEIDMPEPGHDELKNFKSNFDMLLLRTSILRGSNDDTADQLMRRTTWMHQEMQWLNTMKVHAILTGKDPEEVKWRLWKDSKTLKIHYQIISEQMSFNDPAHFEITVIEISLALAPILDETISMYYVEYCFLNMSGPTMESIVLKKPKEDYPFLIFNFVKTFELPLKSENMKLLSRQIEENESIFFSLVGVPFTRDISLPQACIEIGICEVSLQTLIMNDDAVISKGFSVIDERNDEIGILKIQFAGLQDVRRMAVRLLCEKHKYTIF